jgi:hypothetical protein
MACRGGNCGSGGCTGGGCPSGTCSGGDCMRNSTGSKNSENYRNGIAQEISPFTNIVQRKDKKSNILKK